MPELKLAAIAGANSKAKKPNGFTALYGLDPAAGRVQQIVTSEAAPSPSFLAWSEDRSMLYVASELEKGDGRVTGLSVNNDTLIAGNHVATGGNGAVHLCLDRQGQYLFAANYQSDDATGPISVAVFALNRDGSLGAMTSSAIHTGHGKSPSRQSRPHCHSVMISPDNRILAAADLGTDSLYLYRFDATAGTISLAKQLKLPPGTGPRHSVFHPSRPLLYLTGEMNSTLMTIVVDSAAGDGSLIESVAATGWKPKSPRKPNYPSGIAISPDGHYVLAANRNADLVTVYWVDPETGVAKRKHEVPCGGEFPRAIRFDPAARYLAVANQNSGDISVFGWDFAEGVLTEKPLVRFAIPTPLDMVFMG